MFWGEFLVKKNLITEFQLFEAISAQTNSHRSILEILYSEKIISSDKIFELINLQIQSQGDTLSVAKSNNILNENDLLKVISISTLEKKSLGCILVEKGIVDSRDLSDLYIEYVKAYPPSQKSEEISIDEVKSEEPEINSAALESLKELGVLDDSTLSELAPAEEISVLEEESNVVALKVDSPDLVNAAALESLKELGVMDDSLLEELSPAGEKESVSDDSGGIINAAALESLKELEGFDESLLGDSSKENSETLDDKETVCSGLETNSPYQIFIDGFDSEKLQKFEKLISIMTEISEKGDNVANFFNSLFKEIFTLSELVKDTDLVVTQKILKEFEDVSSFLMLQPNNFLINFVKNQISLISDTLNLLWDLKLTLGETGSELTLVDDSKWNSHYTKTMVALTSIKEQKAA